MAVQNETMTAAKAIIKKNGVAIGYMKQLRCTEAKQRGTVMGIGRVTKLERPLMSITCTWNCDFYFIDMKKSGIPGLDNREVQSQQQYEDTLILTGIPCDIVVYKKDVQTITNGVVTAANLDGVLFTIKDVYLDNTSWDISENQISSFSQSGEYTTPVLMSV